MGRSLSAVRNTCFAILSAIEIDTRDVIALSCIEAGQDTFLPGDVRVRATARFTIDIGNALAASTILDFDLLPYTDFGDLSKILFSTTRTLQETYGIIVDPVARGLENLSAARNRVCHSRPLEEEDLPAFLDFAKYLIHNCVTWQWNELKSVQERLNSDPSYVLHLQIPEFWRADKDTIPNNLPLPDYDETGFLGRVIERKDLKKHLFGRHPVITLVGEGGVGKTALALQCAYDLIDLGEQCPYESIVWVSLKNKILTASGINNVRGAVVDVLGVLSESANQLGISANFSSPDNAVSELLLYLTQLKVLLVIDNFETLTNNPLRDFFSEIPEGSKVLLTSRVGLGELELRYALDPMDLKTAGTLLRKYAAAFNLPILSALPQVKLDRYVNFLFRSPLLIKWFVQSVAAGSDPERVISRTNLNFSDALRFCFENLFERLSAAEKEVLHILAAARKQVTFTELMFLIQEISKILPSQIESALSTLHSSSMVKRMAPEPKSLDVSTRLNLTDIAAEYIAKFAPPSGTVTSKVQSALKKLREASEQASVQVQMYKYDLTAVHAVTKDERICALYLNQALRSAKQHRYDDAKANLDKVFSILPSYSEAYRIASFIAGSEGDLFRAMEELDRAIEHFPESALNFYQYAQTALYKLDDPLLALEKIDQAIALDPKEEALKTLRALALVRLGRCQEAAEMYEVLLASIDGRPRKWRITTRDQASECYRRWAEQSYRMKELDRAKGQLERAIDILEGAIAKDDFDDRMGKLYVSIVEDGLFMARSINDIAAAKSLLNRYADAGRAVAMPMFTRFPPELIEQIFKNEPDIDESVWRAFDGGKVELHTVEQSGEESRYQGRIKSPMNKSFGFISCRGRDWFFHRTDLTDSSQWSRIVPDALVSFEEGRDQKGSTKAIHVQLVET